MSALNILQVRLIRLASTLIDIKRLLVSALPVADIKMLTSGINILLLAYPPANIGP